MSGEIESVEASAVAAANRIEFRKFGAKTTNGARLTPLVDGMIFTDSICALIGPANSMKTFIVRDICASVASGTPCFGRKVKKGPVFLLLGEGNSQMELRLRAYEEGHKVRLSGAELRHSNRVCSFAHEAAVKTLSAHIRKQARAIGEAPVLIVIDPLSKVMIGLDENNARDMTTFVNSIDRWFRQRFGCTVILVHHSGHAGGRARGSSALGAAVETSMFVTRKGAKVTIACTKQKDADDFDPVYLQAEKIAVKRRNKDDQIFGESIVLRAGSGPNRPAHERALAILKKLAALHPRNVVPNEIWKAELLKEGVISSSKSFDKRKKRLEEMGALKREGRGVRLLGG